MAGKARTRITMTVLVALFLTACGQGGQQEEQATGSEDTLNIAFFADMSTADPDVFYDIEGLALMLSTYEGLVRYAPGGTEIEGQLAETWEVSDDGLTFTFSLRDGLTYSDGSPLTSQTLKESFERRSAVEQGPSYMLAGVESYETPDDQTFIVKLKEPDVAFIHYLASAWGPKAINPAVLQEHADDLAQKYLETNSAGSGPYVIEAFTRGTGYTLTRNENYWGEEPQFDTVEVAITPDVSSQLLALERGDLDFIAHGFPLSSLPNVENNQDLVVEEFFSLGTTTLYLNHNKDSLADVGIREDVMRALDIPSLVEEVYGDTAEVPTNAYPVGLLDPELAPVDYSPGDGSSLEGEDIALDIVYTPDSSGVQRRLADLMRQRLAAVGVQSTPRQAQLAEVFGYRDDVANAADIYVSTPTPDGAHPDTWGRIVWYTEGPLNFFNYSNPRVDAALDRGLVEVDPEAAAQAYAEAGELATDDWSVVPIAYVSDVVVARSDLTGIEHVPAYPWMVDLAALGR